MANCLYPDIYIPSIFDLDLEYLKNNSIENIIVDIDNTLSRWGSREPSPDVCQWVAKVKSHGFSICILSNSSNKRIRRYCTHIDVLFVENVRKPFKSSFKKAMELLGSSKDNTCVIGDQAFTDILGGNSCGLMTILVSPIESSEFVFTRIMRKLEQVLVKDKIKMYTGD